MLGFPILYFKGTRIMMFQLSGFYCTFCRFLIIIKTVWKSSGPYKKVGSVLFKFRLKELRFIMLRVTAEARKLEHQYPHALKVKYRGS